MLCACTTLIVPLYVDSAEEVLYVISVVFSSLVHFRNKAILFASFMSSIKFSSMMSEKEGIELCYNFYKSETHVKD